MPTMTNRLPDAKHEPLKQLAARRGIRLNKLIEEWSSIALTEFDAEARLRLMASRGDRNHPLRRADLRHSTQLQRTWDFGVYLSVQAAACPPLDSNARPDWTRS